MAQQDRATLKEYFETGDKPTETQFSDSIDSAINITDDTGSITVNLVANTDYNQSNPFTLPIIPRISELLASDGTKILDAYININQTSGDITIQVGANYNGAILNLIGW